MSKFKQMSKTLKRKKLRLSGTKTRSTRSRISGRYRASQSSNPEIPNVILKMAFPKVTLKFSAENEAEVIPNPEYENQVKLVLKSIPGMNQWQDINTTFMTFYDDLTVLKKLYDHASSRASSARVSWSGAALIERRIQELQTCTQLY